MFFCLPRLMGLVRWSMIFSRSMRWLAYEYFLNSGVEVLGRDPRSSCSNVENSQDFHHPCSSLSIEGEQDDDFTCECFS